MLVLAVPRAQGLIAVRQALAPLLPRSFLGLAVAVELELIQL